MKSVLWVMSLMGSVMYILYLIFRPLLKKYCSVQYRIDFLLLSIMFFIVPFPIIKNHYWDVLHNLFGVPYNTNFKDKIIRNPIVVLSDGAVILPKIYKLFLAVSLLIGIIIAARYIYSYVTYIKKKNEILSYSNKIDDLSAYNHLSGFANSKLVKNVEIYSSEHCEPMSMGFIKPIIVIPNGSCTEQCLKNIVNHELHHIKNRDFIIKIYMFAVITLHWFNPLVYFMLREMNKLIELRADAECVIDYDEKERNEYGKNILDFAVDRKLNRNSYINTFHNNNKKIMKERLLEMKKVKRQGKISNLLAMSVLIVSTALTSLTVFAYEDYPVMQVENEEDLDDSGVDVYYTVNLDSEGDSGTYLVPKLPFTADVDTLFLPEGSDAFVPENYRAVDESKAKADCEHNFETGEVTKHIYNDDGSCTETAYEAWVCSKCDKTVRIKLKSKGNTVVCNHK